VEQIANCSDDQIRLLGMNANNLRQKARAYLNAAAKNASAQQHAEEMAAKDKELAELKEGQRLLTEQMAQLTAALTAQPAKRKGGRPRKEKPPTEEAVT